MLQKKNKEKWKICLKDLLITVRLRMSTKIKKNGILLNAKEFYKGRKEVLIAFEENMFPLPRPYMFGKNEWKESDDFGDGRFVAKTLTKNLLEKYDQIPLSRK